ncbi:DMT family transporter [Vibrio sonorensis]|uniref:DMT family transporter n=1 Tax=Vibrio sonorensis TaxID=1004316 RepID=UPI0008DA764A|nr:DMT family transporter [Vibrio sonorensis]
MTMTTSTSESESSHSQYQLGVIFALLACVLFSIKPVMVKIAYQYGGDASSILALRALSSLPFYLVILVHLCRKQEHRNSLQKHGLKAAAIGVLGYYFASYLDIMSLAYISAQLERLLIFMFPTFVVLISWIFYGTKPSRSVWIATIVGYMGTALIFTHDLSTFGSSVTAGAALAIGSALAFSFYLIWSKPLIGHMGSSLFTSVGMGSAGIAIVIHLMQSGSNPSTWSMDLILLGIFLGIFCTVVPSYLVAAAMARLSPTQVSLTSNMGPGITAAAAVLLLGELFTVWHAIGMTLVVLSVVVINKNK